MDSKIILQLLNECAEGKNMDVKSFTEIFKKALLDVIKRKYGNEAEKYFDISVDIKNECINIFVFKEIVSNKEKEIPFNKIKLSDALKIESDFVIGETCTTEFDFNEFSREDINRLRGNIINFVKKEKALKVYNKYSKLKNSIVNVSVYQRCKYHFLLKDDEDNELILPFKEMISNETFRKKQFIKVAIKDIVLKEYETIVIVSRIIPAFLRSLLEYIIPEIADGIIGIKDIVRIAGVRSKVIVESYNVYVDAVRTCIGVRGSVVNKISDELNGEYVDFIKYSSDLNEYMARLLSVPSIRMLKEFKNSIFAYIDPEYIGLAIGKDGVNIKLVRMLLDKHVDVFKYNSSLDSKNLSSVEELNGLIDDWVISETKDAGFDTLESILNISKEEFEKKTDLEICTIDQIYKLSEDIINKKQNENN